MKKSILLLMAISTAIFSCTTSSSTTGSTTTAPTATDSSTFTLTFNGKTYHGAQGLVLNSSGVASAYLPSTGSVLMSAQTFVTNNSTSCVVTSNVLSNYLFSLQAMAIGRTNPLGIDTGMTSSGAYKFTDVAAGNLVYMVDSNSTINITQSDAHWVAGTMNLKLTQSSSHYTATGNFKIYKP